MQKGNLLTLKAINLVDKINVGKMETHIENLNKLK